MTYMACCKCCCGKKDCEEGDQGKCCCGDTCCTESEYCCDGACQAEPCGGRECCNSDGTCSNFCPAPVCDNNPAPGETPDGAPCCDPVCIGCGDCGDGGEECCNSTQLASVFDALSDEPESIDCEVADAEVSEEFGPVAAAAWGSYVSAMRFGEVYKFSLMRRSYVLDALYEIRDGSIPEVAMSDAQQRWAQFANAYRGVING